MLRIASPLPKWKRCGESIPVQRIRAPERRFSRVIRQERSPDPADGAPGSLQPHRMPPFSSASVTLTMGKPSLKIPSGIFRTLNFDKDVAFGDQKAGPVLNSTNPDLRSFRARGGKLIQYHGWGDAAIAPLSSIEYYENVRAFLTRFPDCE